MNKVEDMSQFSGKKDHEAICELYSLDILFWCDHTMIYDCLSQFLCDAFFHYHISRKDQIRKRESRMQRLQSIPSPGVDHAQVLLGVDRSNSVAMPSPNNNSNWFLKEKPPEEVRSSSLARAAGNEPFIVGRSLARYSKELNRSDYRPSNASRYVRSRSESDWKRGSLPMLSATRPETEERMVRLGMIPPRSQEGGEHYPMGYMTAPHPRAKSPTKDGKKKSKELQESGRYNGDVLMPVREVQLWQLEDSHNPPPFALPKEDYNTEGVTWYRSKSLDGQSLTGPTAFYNYPRHGPQVHNSQTPSRGIPTEAHLGHASPTAANAMLEEYYAAQTPEKLKRIQRVGVPILPD